MLNARRAESFGAGTTVTSEKRQQCVALHSPFLLGNVVCLCNEMSHDAVAVG